jgi:peptidoglycan-N-acetylglucosamine deacetylase
MPTWGTANLEPGPRWTPSAGRILAAALVALGVALLAWSPSPGARVRSARPVWGFMALWDPNALTTFDAHASQLSIVLPTGLTLAGRGGLVSDHLPESVVDLAHRRGVRVEPVLSNYRGGWQSALADRVLSAQVLRARLVSRLAGLARAGGWDGVNLDLERLTARDGGGLVALVRELGRALGPGRDVSVDVPATPSPGIHLGALGHAAGHVLLMAYDQHASAGDPGPIATPGWVAASRRRALGWVPASRLVIALPSYAYEWIGRRAPRPLDYPAALQLAARARAVPRWSSGGKAPGFAFGRGQHRHTVWMADALALAADLRAGAPAGAAVAIWRLGAEDPGSWPLLAAPAPGDEVLAHQLGALAPPPQVRVRGTGDIIRAVPGAPGWRAVTSDVTAERYMLLPRPWGIQRFGGHGKRVAITFDDGPSSQWTPKIIDELTRLHVPATFFVVGENAAARPGLVSQEVDAGFTVGNHTFTHPNLATASAWRTRVEVTATNRLIVGITGRRPMLFRAPYAADSAPSGPGQVRPLVLVQHLGDTVVAASLNSQDYLRPGVGRIVSNVFRGLRSGDIILFHDGGGDRSQTVAALPIVVRRLRADGYRIVSVARLAGLREAALMPSVGGAELWLSRAFAMGAEAWFSLTRWVALIGMILIGLLAARALLLALLALRHHRRGRRPAPAGAIPAVTVLVPAHDEAAVIGRTIESLMGQRGLATEVLVIDDGSTDGTAAAAERLGVRVIRQANAGKWTALNRGLIAAEGEVVVAIDADTVVEPDAVARLAARFADPTVGAVSGTAKVGNRHTLVTLWQHVEYVTSFNLDRRAYSDLNAITVVPGAIGAWRRSALLEVGGYSGRTLAEDCDITIALRRAGWRIVHEPSAVAWTEAPETMRGLARQRLRWTFGTFQVLWLNRAALFRPREGALGLIALPYAWLYQVVLSVLAPAIDLVVLLALLTGGWRVALWWFAVASVAEMGLSWLAFRMEGEPAWPVLTLPLQRAFYRQLMYVTVLRSLGCALAGRRMGWGKLARTGSVRTG